VYTKTEKPFVHLLAMPTGKYVFDVNRDLVFKVNDTVFAYLADEQRDGSGVRYTADASLETQIQKL